MTPNQSFNLRSIFTLIALVFISGACVSVNIGPKGPQRSQGVSYSTPASPFEELKDTRADGAWQNRRNGSSISFFSTCHDAADPTLESATRDLFAGLSDMNVIRSENTRFNGREALNMEVEGRVEGVTTRIRTMVFKKNGCLYTLNHIAVPRAFEEDRGNFNKFLGSFEAP